MDDPLSALVAAQGFVVIDGGLGSELEERGHDLSTSDLWSARLIMDCPEAIAAVHKDYFDAGADVATTATYQAWCLPLLFSPPPPPQSSSC
jgi:homocysteine S-methyltransferase